MGGRGRGRGRGGGEGTGSSNAKALDLETLNKAARDIQHVLNQISPSQGNTNQKNKNARGSSSMMDLTGGQGRESGRGGGGGRGRGGGGRGGGEGGRGGGGGSRGRGGQQCNVISSQHKKDQNQQQYQYHQQPRGGQHPRGYHHQQQQPRGGQQHHHQQPRGGQHPRGYHHHQQPRGGQHPRGYHHHQQQQQQPRGGHHHHQPRSRTPPPTYDESMGSKMPYYPPPSPLDFAHMPSAPLMQDPMYPKIPPPADKVSSGQITLDIVKALVRFEGQWSTADALARQIQRSEKDVLHSVQSHPHIFKSISDKSSVKIEIVPNIQLCPDYETENGCLSKASCSCLHLCKNYIMNRCNDTKLCQFGHRFDTDHNTSVLSKFYLDLIEWRLVMNIIRKVCKGNMGPQLCSFYCTPKGCFKDDKCDRLHICRDFLVGNGNCPNEKCPYDHLFTSKQCGTILTKHGISVNESKRDIIHSLRKAIPDLEPSDRGDANKDKSSRNKDEKDVASAKPMHNKETNSGGTIKSTDVYGDVEIPGICVYNINNKCRNEKKGCKYLHAKSLFHWQVQKKKWYNLRVYQSKCLETKYRDVSVSEVTIPPLDPNRMEGQENALLDVLGTDPWTADFILMIIKNKNGQKLNIRRLSTASAAESKIPQATVYEWFFCDEQDKWIKYGNVDSLGKQQFVCSITSEEIEKQYILDSSKPIPFNSAQYTYLLDLKQMTQTNTSTRKEREIRRRPTRLSYQRNDAGDGGDSLPPHWIPMTSDQTHLLLPVDNGSQEYSDIVSLVRFTLPKATIHTIHRLQNQYLWRLMQYKKADLATSYSSHDMNIQKLFHGTNSDLVDGICKENIDFRKADSTKNKYGKGTYFSNSCAIALKQGTADSRGKTTVILTEVIVGQVTQGSSKLTRPPVNPVTGNPFDTTVDDETAPRIFVKFDKEEFYPAYVIELY